MKIFYNSKIAKLFTFLKGYETIMLFGNVFTEDDHLTDKEKQHEGIHCQQYSDYFGLGLGIAIILLFILLGLNGVSANLFWLALIPLTLYYVAYGIEYIYKLIKCGKDKAYKEVSFEKEAYTNAEIDCYLMSRESFSNLKYI